MTGYKESGKCSANEDDFGGVSPQHAMSKNPIHKSFKPLFTSLTFLNLDLEMKRLDLERLVIQWKPSAHTSLKWKSTALVEVFVN